MSTCISSQGEFGEHILDRLHTCVRCRVLDEEALRVDLQRATAELAEEKRRTKAQLAERQKDYSKTLKESVAEVERLTSELASVRFERELLNEAFTELRPAAAAEDWHREYGVVLVRAMRQRDEAAQRADRIDARHLKASDERDDYRVRWHKTVSRRLADRVRVQPLVDAARAWREAKSASPYLGTTSEELDLIAAMDSFDAKPEQTDESSVNAVDETPHPCQPIGCDNGYHLIGCVFAEVDDELADVLGLAAARRDVIAAARRYAAAWRASIVRPLSDADVNEVSEELTNARLHILTAVDALGDGEMNKRSVNAEQEARTDAAEVIGRVVEALDEKRVAEKDVLVKAKAFRDAVAVWDTVRDANTPVGALIFAVDALTAVEATLQDQDVLEMIHCPTCPGMAKLIVGLTYQCPHCLHETVEAIPRQLQPDGTYEPVEATSGPARCPACQTLPLGHEGDCE